MSSRYFVLNILLFFVVLLMAFTNYETWIYPLNSLPDKGVMPKGSETKNENPPMEAFAKEPMSSPAYSLISEKNVFSPERKEFSTTPVEQPKPPARPQIILYGVAITPDYQSASVLNPGRPLYKGERETKTIKVGDRMGGYQLAKILPDRITMEASGDSFDVLLYDPKVPKKKSEIRTAEVKTAQPFPVATATDVQKPGPQGAVLIAKESVPERPAPPQSPLYRGTNFPNRSLARKSRAALLSQAKDSQK
ncbi:MAG: hypothetical protein OEW45_13645 [Deltaproteobacteria bacterium]|nr:hypothetical protein [Deltaproteobacteria bacterium]